MSDSEPIRRRGITFGRPVPISTLPDIIEAPFPERRTIHWLPPDQITTEEIAIVITSEVVTLTNRHVKQSLKREHGGFLLGNRYRCPNTGREYVVIDQYVEADFTESTDVSLTFTHQAWSQLEEELTGKYYGKKLAGWYHSHPGMSIFLSEHDLLIHRQRFSDPWMVALVLEPEKHLGGFFAWSNGQIDPNHYVDFYELRQGDSREPAVTWTNYQRPDPAEAAIPAHPPVNPAVKKSPEHAVVEAEPPVFAANSSTRPSSSMPEWLRGNLLLFGIVCLAVLIPLGILLWKNIGGEDTNSAVFNSLEVTLQDRGHLNLDSGDARLRFTISGLSDEVSKKLKREVTINGYAAQVRDLNRTGGQLVIEATANLQERLPLLRERHIDRLPVPVLITCSYGAASEQVDRTINTLVLQESASMNLLVNGPTLVAAISDIERRQSEQARELAASERAREKELAKQRDKELAKQREKEREDQRRQNQNQNQPQLNQKVASQIARQEGVVAGLRRQVNQAVQNSDNYKKLKKQLDAAVKKLDELRRRVPIN